MKNNEFQEKMNTMQEKIGQEASALILDDIGLLLTDNQNMNKTIEEKEAEITKLKERNEKLLEVNGNLLQQVPMADDLDTARQKEEQKPKEPFDYKTLFDEKRKF